LYIQIRKYLLILSTFFRAKIDPKFGMSSYSQQVPDGLKPHNSKKPGGENSDLPIRYIMTQISEEGVRLTSMYIMTQISEYEGRIRSIRLPNGNS